MTVAAATENTFPKLLMRNARACRPAGLPAQGPRHLADLDLGGGARPSAGLALGLAALGLKRGDKVAIIGDNRPRLYGDVRRPGLGGVPVPVYPDSVAEEMAYVLDHAEVTFAVVEDQEQVDKLHLDRRSAAAALRHLIYDEPRGLRDYDHTRCTCVRGRAAARARGAARPTPAGRGSTRSRQGQGRRTSRDALHLGHHRPAQGRDADVRQSDHPPPQNGNAFDVSSANDDVLAYLPMAWVGDHIFSYAQAYAAGMCVSCPESPETVVEDRREIGPTYFLRAAARVREPADPGHGAHGGCRLAEAHACSIISSRVARRCGEQILDGKPVPLMRPAALWAGRSAGLRAAARTGSASRACASPIPPARRSVRRSFAFYRSLGINLKQLYGQTEASVYITAQPDGEVYPDTVGKPTPTSRSRSPTTARCCSSRPACSSATTRTRRRPPETKTPDGWVHTGDAGFFDPRAATSRSSTAPRTSAGSIDGALFAPKYLENKLKFYPEITRGGGVRRQARLRHVHAQHRSRRGRQLGRAQQRRLRAAIRSWPAHPQVYDMMAQARGRGEPGARSTRRRWRARRSGAS